LIEYGWNGKEAIPWIFQISVLQFNIDDFSNVGLILAATGQLEAYLDRHQNGS
jgi:hypothetical protein